MRMKRFPIFTFNSFLISSILIFFCTLLLSCDSTKHTASVDNPSSEKYGEVVSGLTMITEAPFTLPTCSGNDCCNRSVKCIKQCDGLFSEEEHKKECLSLPINWVAQMEEVLDTALTNPNRADLEKIDLPVLWSIVEISEKPWVGRINDYSKVQAQTVLSWLAHYPHVSSSTFDSRTSVARSTLIALFRKNTRSSLVDDNALLSGLQSSITEEDGFLEVADKQNNRDLVSLVHKQVIKGHLCDYPINQPKPIYSSENTYEACILAVYCHITGSYQAGQYSGKDDGGRNIGQKLRKEFAAQMEEKDIEDFIQAPIENGGLAVTTQGSDDWTDATCAKLTELWNDQNLKFNL